MAKKHTLLLVLCLAVAFVALPATSEEEAGPEPAPSSSPEPTASSSPEPTTSSTSNSEPTATQATLETGATTEETNDTSSSTEASTSTPPLTNPCDPNPCGDGISCELVGEGYRCLCLPGDFYDPDTSSCNKAKVFPGNLKLSEPFLPKLKDKTSPEFQVLSKRVTDAFNRGLSDGKYIGSKVVEFQPYMSSTKSTRDEKTEALVEMIFKPISPITQEDLNSIIQESITCEKCPLKGAQFSASDLCVSQPCDAHSTDCVSKDGSFTCSCKEGYLAIPLSDRVCIACPSGQKVQESKCVNCPFGYSGWNCNEDWKLILVIVGSVLGGLLLITLIILPVVALKSPKKSSKKSKNEDIGKPYVSHSPAKAPLVNSSFVSRPAPSFNGSANGPSGNIGVPRIPRATSNNNWDSRNNLEMTQSNSQQNLVPGRNTRLNDDSDDAFPYAQSRSQSNPYAQSRTQSNPFAQNRAHVNPYAERQGHSNPYYTHDDGRRQ